MGKNKYIETPQKLWELFIQYKTKVKSEPILKHDFKGKDATPVYYELEAPLTLSGFENYVADLNIIADLGHYFANTDDKYTDYCTICSRIKRVIRDDQIRGGMVGIYNPSITQRLNGLVERNETTHKQEQTLLDDLRKNDKSK